ncbi:hypothetical protein GENT11_15810 [Flavobacterium ammonificans]|uniref:Uncharacterized protein n=1 Tax=Flavobacterium ammonificans TaxID=1751056 RepID=A0ABM7V2D7_9FLAO|nr:hypothetical protein GENT11_15810 [Flavobacterium ammonificans]
MAFKKGIELELSITITKGVFTVLNVFLVTVGLIIKIKSPKKVIKRKKAKNKFKLDLFLAL